MVRVSVETEVYLEDEITRLREKDLEELRREINNRLSGKHLTLFGGTGYHESLPPVDGERVYTTLLHLHAGNIDEAKRELNRAFEQAVSPLFRAGHFMKESA